MIDYPLKILLIEDTLSDVTLISRQLRKVIKNPNIHHVSDFKDFTISLKFLRPDIIISDYLLVNYSGLDVLRYTEEHSPNTPFVFVTSSMDDYNLAENTILGKVTLFVLKNNINEMHKSILPVLEDIVNAPKKSGLNFEQRAANDMMKTSIQQMNKENEQHIKSYKQIGKDLENYNDQPD